MGGRSNSYPDPGSRRFGEPGSARGGMNGVDSRGAATYAPSPRSAEPAPMVNSGGRDSWRRFGDTGPANNSMERPAVRSYDPGSGRGAAPPVYRQESMPARPDYGARQEMSPRYQASPRMEAPRVQPQSQNFNSGFGRSEAIRPSAPIVRERPAMSAPAPPAPRSEYRGGGGAPARQESSPRGGGDGGRGGDRRGR